MKAYKLVVTAFFFICLLNQSGLALESTEIIVVANSEIKESVQLAEYYCEKRNVPADNIVALSLGNGINDTISRIDYEKKIAEPLRKKLCGDKYKDKIKCLVTVYGVPIKVGPRGFLKERQKDLEKTRELLEQEKNKLKAISLDGGVLKSIKKRRAEKNIKKLQTNADYITGKETNASVDSELSMVLFDGYELYKWQSNDLSNPLIRNGSQTIMVSRLDGPGFDIAKGLVDKAIKAEKTGLKGNAYIDSRGIEADGQKYSFGSFDQHLRDLAVLVKFRTAFELKHEKTEKLFQAGQCPQAALYCGWYSLQKYIDAFDFVDGAIGFHIASWEAIDLRDPNSSQWCAAMLKDGITATLGAVAEPYLSAFPPPDRFFFELVEGKCLVEAYYHTKPFNSWQMILVGDPLYRPFPKR